VKHLILLVTCILLQVIPLKAAQGPRVMPVQISVDSADTLLGAFKVEAGLALAFDLSHRYSYITSWERDSLLGGGGTTRTALEAARELDASVLAFCSTSRIGQLVRTELSLRTGESFDDLSTGVGYAVIRYENDSTFIADPAILASQQRALCSALRDSSLYLDAGKGLDVRPTTLMAVGGIAFENDSAIAPFWSLFENRTVVSFDVAATIVNGLQGRAEYTMIDVETRDEMYAKAGMLLVENDRASSFSDMRILRLFEVELIVTGSFERIVGGAKLTLQLRRIEPDGRYTVLGTSSQLVTADSLLELRKATSEALRQLDEIISR